MISSSHSNYHHCWHVKQFLDLLASFHSSLSSSCSSSSSQVFGTVWCWMRDAFLLEPFWMNRTDSSPGACFCSLKVRAAKASASLSRSERSHTSHTTLNHVTSVSLCLIVRLDRRPQIMGVPLRLSWRQGCRTQTRGRCWTPIGQASWGPRWVLFWSYPLVMPRLSLSWNSFFTSTYNLFQFLSGNEQLLHFHFVSHYTQSQCVVWILVVL